jgi:hypothetical protein
MRRVCAIFWSSRTTRHRSCWAVARRFCSYSSSPIAASTAIDRVSASRRDQSDGLRRMTLLSINFRWPPGRPGRRFHGCAYWLPPVFDHRSSDNPWVGLSALSIRFSNQFLTRNTPPAWQAQALRSQTEAAKLMNVRRRMRCRRHRRRLHPAASATIFQSRQNAAQHPYSWRVRVALIDSSLQQRHQRAPFLGGEDERHRSAFATLLKSGYSPE